ncbi:hypothetical protein C2E23DRAFT_728256 [Lenzites betulinus]|nr:hypothetical protein C2E23DRAFT_728256 [Lenzites betulinus]
MHLVSLNITDLFVSLWRGTIHGSKSDPTEEPWAVLQDDTWVSHGAEVARAASFLPGSYDRPPRNIAEKISSGYKAKEWMTYFYGYGPAMLRRTLPQPYLKNYTKFVAAGQLLGRCVISRAELVRADQMASEAETEFEELYYHRDPDLLHHVRPCIHGVGHGAREVTLTGPLPGHGQYTMERSIGDLGGEIRLPSNPFANLSERALLRCQVNALKAMIPGLDDNAQPRLPRGSLDLGNDFVLLRARDSCPRWVPACEAAAFYWFWANLGQQPIGDEAAYSLKVRKWARLRLPNDQVARSAWKESTKPLAKLRIARIVKVLIEGRAEIAEVRYFCRISPPDSEPDATVLRTVALVSVFGRRDEDLFDDLHGTVWLAPYEGNAALRVVDIHQIQSVVAMVPDSDVSIDLTKIDEPHFQTGENYFLVEKLGLEASHRSGALETIVENEEE